jgi:hypothetical protein
VNALEGSRRQGKRGTQARGFADRYAAIPQEQVIHKLVRRIEGLIPERSADGQ